MNRVLAAIVLAAAMLHAARSEAQVVIDLVYDGSVSTSQQQVFDQAAGVWQSLLLGYANDPGITLTINVSLPDLGGPGGVLGSAGPDSLVASGPYIYTHTGSMEFDIADVPTLEAEGTFFDVVLHEMAHVIGFGTLWTNNGVYGAPPGQFQGSTANAYWASEFGQSGRADVERGGGPGTANGHWNEVDGGAGLVGITDSQGRDMRDELMTGWLNADGPGPNPPSFISQMTVGSFADIGYLIPDDTIIVSDGMTELDLALFSANNLLAVPEPPPLGLLSLPAFWGLYLFYRRRRAA